MKNSKLILFLMALFISVSICAQDLKLKEVSLPAPPIPSFKYFKTLGERHIFYGKKPMKPNGKVILFVPGYVEEADFLLLGNCFYKYAYTEGYQTAFLSMTRGQGDWVNGEILQRAIEQVKAYYKTNKINIVAHSNGGKASEVALFHYGKITSVDNIVTLGTPFRGTQIADFMDFNLSSWVLSILGLEAGRAYSTSFYCDTQWRPYFDRIETKAQKRKFYNYGAWGYLHGKELLYSGLMAVSGAIIKLNGGGDNDGVTPFYSSTLPGGNQLYKNYAPEGKMNHMDMVYGQHTWKGIRSVLNNSPVRNTSKSVEQTISAPDESEYSTSSNYQILANYKGSLQKDAQATKLKVTLIKEDANSLFDLVNNTTGDEISFADQATNSLRSTNGNDENKHIDELTISFASSKLRSTGDQKEDQFSLVGESRFLAIAEQDIDCPMNYTFRNTVDETILEVNFPQLNKQQLAEVAVSARIHYLGSLDGELAQDQKALNVDFKLKGDKFVYNASDLQDGVYSIAILGQIEGVYKRDLNSGFTVGKLEATIKSAEESLPLVSDSEVGYSLYPNPSTELLNVSIAQPANYVIADLQGRNILSGSLVAGTNSLSIQSLMKGIYVITVQKGLLTESQKFVVK